MMFVVARLFATGQDPAKMAEFDKRWDLPSVPRRFRVVTAVWGLGLLGEAVLRTVLALTLSTQVFLIAAQIVNWSVLGALIAFSIVATRRSEQYMEQLRAAIAPHPSGPAVSSRTT